MLLTLRPRPTLKSCMAQDQEIAAKIRAWMESVLATKGWTAAGWAKKADVASSTVQRPLKPSYAFVTSSRTLAKLASAANVEAPEFQPEGDARVVPVFLRVRYAVQAGHWFEEDYDEAQTLGTHPVAVDPRYRNYPQWLEKVVGDSVNLKIPDGGFAHVVDAIEMGYAPRHGDYVVVERARHAGQLKERTIKQVELAYGIVRLWPRSSNPKWSSPVEVASGTRPGEDVQVSVVGLVIGAYLGFD